MRGGRAAVLSLGSSSQHQGLNYSRLVAVPVIFLGYFAEAAPFFPLSREHPKHTFGQAQREWSRDAPEHPSAEQSATGQHGEEPWGHPWGHPCGDAGRSTEPFSPPLTPVLFTACSASLAAGHGELPGHTRDRGDEHLA